MWGTWVDCGLRQSGNAHLKTPLTRCATEHLIDASGASGRSLDQRHKVSTVRIRWDLEPKCRVACEAALQKLHFFSQPRLYCDENEHNQTRASVIHLPQYSSSPHILLHMNVPLAPGPPSHATFSRTFLFELSPLSPASSCRLLYPVVRNGRRNLRTSRGKRKETSSLDPFRTIVLSTTH